MGDHKIKVKNGYPKKVMVMIKKKQKQPVYSDSKWDHNETSKRLNFLLEQSMTAISETGSSMLDNKPERE